jgi:hypothetical protein
MARVREYNGRAMKVPPKTPRTETAQETREREDYLNQVNADYARLRADPKAWAEFQEEIAIWDTTNLDGLEDE